MENNFVKVRSESDSTIVINLPEMQLHRTFRKRGQEFLFARQDLMQAYYDPSVEYLFTHGFISTDDVEFKESVGLIQEGKDVVTLLTDKQKDRVIRLMPLSEVKQFLKTLNFDQITELTDYAIEHYKDLKMDRIDILSQYSKRNLLKTIDNFKKAEE